MGSGRRVQVGANLGLIGLFGGDLGSPVQVEFLGERYARPGGAADHRVTLFGIVNFGARSRPACETEGSCVKEGAGTGGLPAPGAAPDGVVVPPGSSRERSQRIP